MGKAMNLRPIVFLSLLMLNSSAYAKGRDYCPDRPGIGTPACTIEKGRASVEFGLLDLTLDRDETSKQSTAQIASVLIRRGITDHNEVQLGWAGFGFHRERDRATGNIDHRSGGGDLTVALRQNLKNPDGSSFAFAVMPYMTFPVGRSPIGDGDWSAGFRLPVSYEISDRLTLVTTSEIQAAVDHDGDGRHLAFGEVVGVAIQLAKHFTATAEYEIVADRDPQGRLAEHKAALSLGWIPAGDLQFDVGANKGLDGDASNLEVYMGISRRF